MSEELKYKASCLLLRMEMGIISKADVQERIDKWITGLEDISELVEISLASNDYELIRALYAYLNHSIQPSAYKVSMSDLLISNNETDSLKKLGILVDYLQSKDGTEAGSQLHKLDSFLEKLFKFVQWCWNELHLARNGVLWDLDQLENYLLKLFEYLINFKEDNRNEWERNQHEVVELINQIIVEREQNKKQRPID